jgi:hypothetical protein
MARASNKIINKKYESIYYGTFRKNRENYFVEYLRNNMHLSTSVKNFKKYKSIGCTPIWINKLNWSFCRETLNLFKYSLYIEDEYTHNVYNNLANRFYEAGFCNNILFFDEGCTNTIERSGIDIDSLYTVESHKDLILKTEICNKDFKKHLKIQKKWHNKSLEEKKDVLIKLKNIVEGK